MTDISLPSRGPVLPSRWLWLIGVAVAAVFVVLVKSNWSAVTADSVAQRWCEMPRGSFSSGFSGGFDADRCGCKQPSLDFSNSCNPIYVPIIFH
jgi:hypothetical protein